MVILFYIVKKNLLKKVLKALSFWKILKKRFFRKIRASGKTGL
jgi:hypothetical protein